MNDRDRLVDDINDWGVVSGTEALADYLIALGWTRNMTADDAAYDAGREDGLAECIDEERLARALLMAGYSWESPSDLRPDLIRRFAAAIAKAYREDTDARLP